MDKEALKSAAIDFRKALDEYGDCDYVSKYMRSSDNVNQMIAAAINMKVKSPTRLSLEGRWLLENVPWDRDDLLMQSYRRFSILLAGLESVLDLKETDHAPI